MGPCWAASAARNSAWIVSARSPAKTSTSASRSSGTSPSFEAQILKRIWHELALVFISLAAIGGLATAYVSHSGWTLFYGDAEAHLDIARRVFDSRTPG